MREIAQFFKALGDETRLQMLWMLFHHRELCVCDFMEVLKITQSKASRHLRNLYHAGLVEDRRVGTWSYYRLRAFDDALVQTHMSDLEKGLACCDELVCLREELAAWMERKDRGQKACCS